MSVQLFSNGRLALLLGLLVLGVLSSPGAGAQSTNNTITTSTSSSQFLDDTLLPAIRINTYRTRLLGLLQGDGTHFYDQTFATPFGDASVTAGVAAAMAVLTGANAGDPLSFLGPTLDGSIESLLSSSTATTQIGDPQITLSIQLEDTIGPGTIIIGDRDNGGTAFEVLAGTNNINTNTHTHYLFNREIQTTDEYEIFDTWRLIGVPQTVSVPEPGTMSLLALGLLGMLASGMRRARRHS